MNGRRKSDDQSDESCLRTCPKDDAIDFLFRVSPQMEPLKRPQRLVGPAGECKLEGVRQNRPNCTHQNRPKVCRGAEQKERDQNSKQAIRADGDGVLKKCLSNAIGAPILGAASFNEAKKLADALKDVATRPELVLLRVVSRVDGVDSFSIKDARCTKH
jgi:hypothetical protein